MIKTSILTAAALFISVLGFAQDTQPRSSSGFLMASNVTNELNVNVRGVYTNPLKKADLDGVQLLNDFMSYYPKNWIEEYVSVEISGSQNGKIVMASGLNNRLNAEQKNILDKAELATNLIVNVRYRMKNPITNVIELNQLFVTYTIVPEVEAEYVGGNQKLTQYLRDYAINSIAKSYPIEFQKGAVKFTINEEGNVSTAKISLSSGDSKVDKLLLDVINNMPKWNPAKNEKGAGVEQEFEFSFGIGGC